MRSAAFQLGLVPFGCNRLIVTYWISLRPRVRRASFRHSASSHSPLLVGICFNLVLCVIARALKDLGFSHVRARPKAYKQTAEALDALARRALPGTPRPRPLSSFRRAARRA